ncbi:OsmC family peroxiredoxin [Rhodohalobacter sp. SW132]|uniref:OsmC family protein n=1 Tax=Rhodohalobacter sp. SW132 TaxID=2293433 RepID=UPI000E23523B|nr:OsmC family protein [Rhodohalobacter sp. SW132]REL37764.1 OsmC family peroxiredoxin [Rhodohalobacter sp. SW132]
MDSNKLRELQAPLKSQYKDSPESAIITLSSEGKIGDGITCKVDTGKAMVEAGLHPATGGDGLAACSGDMLLDALVACAGVTLNAVATAIGVSLGEKTHVTAEGDLDFRGTLGVSKEAPVGFKEIRLTFHLDTDAEQDQIDSLIKLTERYCVVFQTLNVKPELVTANKVIG